MSFNITNQIPQNTGIKVSYFDSDGKKVGGLTVEDANKVAEIAPSTLFYFQNGDGTEEELNINQVNQLTPESDLLPQSSECSTAPVVCGPPLVQFFGGGGYGAAANPVISSVSSSVIGFDIINPGKGFQSPPFAELIDSCGKGSGSSLTVNMQPNGSSIKNITINAPGDGYLSAPDGSLGGNERVWKEPFEGYVKKKDGGYYVVQPNRPIPVKVGDEYFAPDKPPRKITEDEIINLKLVPPKPIDPKSSGTPYPVILCIEEIKVIDKGFGYRPGDQLVISPNNGTLTELVVNELGQIESVKILKGGCGYEDFPTIQTNSPTGFNATFTPIFKVTRIDPTIPIEQQIPQPEKVPQPGDPTPPFAVPQEVKLVTVIDCVGRTF